MCTVKMRLCLQIQFLSLAQEPIDQISLPLRKLYPQLKSIILFAVQGVKGYVGR